MREPIGNYATKPPIAVLATDTVAKARNQMVRFDIGRLLVVDEKRRPVGIITRTDMLKTLSRREMWRRPLDRLLVSDFMTKGVICVNEKITVSEAARLMFERNIGGLPVVDESGKCVGIVTAHDMIGIYARSELRDVPVRDVMERRVPTVRRLHSIHRVIELMGKSELRRVVVVDEEGRPTGIVTPTDIAFLDPRVYLKAKKARVTRGFTISRLLARRKVKLLVPVAEDVMTTPVILAGVEEGLKAAARRMYERGIGALPVVDENNKLVGMVAKRHVIKVTAEADP